MQSGKAEPVCEKTSKNSWHDGRRRRQSDDADASYIIHEYQCCSFSHTFKHESHHGSADIIGNSGQATLFVIIHLHKKPLMTLYLRLH